MTSCSICFDVKLTLLVISQDDDYDKCASESSKIENLYNHYFDATIVNENIDVAYEELLATVRVFSTGKHWVPANWVM